MLMRNYSFFSIYNTKMEPIFELRSCSSPWMRDDLYRLLTSLHENRFPSVLFTASLAPV